MIFHPSKFPAVGVGLEYHFPPRPMAAETFDTSGIVDPIVTRLADGQLPCLNFFEFQPSHYVFEPRLLDLAAHMPVLLHSSSLSLGSVGIEMDREFLQLTRRLLDKTASPWLAEHISWNRFHGGDTRHFILPTLTQDIADTIVANATELRRVTGRPLLLENAPRTFSIKLDDEKPEGEFISDIIERSECGFLLDLDSAILTAHTMEYDLTEYLRSLPLDRLIEIHTGNPMRDWEILSKLFQSSPVKAVTLDWDISQETDDPRLHEVVSAIKALLPQPMLRHRATPASPSGKTPHEPEHAPFLDANTVFKLSEAVSCCIHTETILFKDRQRNLMLESPAGFLPLFRHFLTPQTMESALLLPGVLECPALGENIGFLRDLIQHGILSPHSSHSSDPLETQAPYYMERSPDIWANWDAALDFYLSTRTKYDAPYISVLNLEKKLEKKTSGQRQPSAFKDYFAHPFYPLENPLQLPPAGVDRRDLLDTLLHRKTCRTFERAPLSSAHLSQLLYYTWGATLVEKNRMGDFFLKKTSPSGGSLHGTEVYPILMNVDGFARGIYHYSARRHGLELVSREDPREWIVEACGGQPWIDQAAAVFLSTARLERMAWKYEFSRAFRAVLMDIGHLSQTFSLVATSLGLGCCTTAALRDEIFEQKFGLDYLEEPVFLINGVGQIADLPKTEDFT